MLDIRRRRLLKGWTQEQLAEKAEITRVTVTRLENGKPTSIDFGVLERLATALGVKPGALIVQAPESSVAPDGTTTTAGSPVRMSARTAVGRRQKRDR